MNPIAAMNSSSTDAGLGLRDRTPRIVSHPETQGFGDTMLEGMRIEK
jgi:hypothetical protein